MLDLDLDLEADLGIDTVKQAEMFATVRAAYNIPRDQNLQAARLPDPRARHSIRRDAASGRRQPVAGGKHRRVPDHPRPSRQPTRIPRRVPVPALRPPLDIMQANRRHAGARPPRVRHAGQRRRGRGLTARLQTLGVEVRWMHDRRSARRWRRSQGVYWLPALDDEGDLSDMTWPPGTRPCASASSRFYRTMRSLYDRWRRRVRS